MHHNNDKYKTTVKLGINTLRPRQNGRHFPDDIFKWIFVNENAWISLKIPLKVVPRFRINNIPPLVQIMAWRRLGDKPLSEPIMVSLLTHICVTRPQWVNLRKNMHNPHGRFLVIRATNRNGQNRNGHRPKWPQTETTTNWMDTNHLL